MPALSAALTFAAASSIKRTPSVCRHSRRASAIQRYLSRRFDVMAKQIMAPMPGKVIDILVKEGEEVLEYQDVLVLEAMKMENAIPAPEAGKIKKINVKKDDTVVTQQVLIELE
jgi:biotin carboxyl carrier protein